MIGAFYTGRDSYVQTNKALGVTSNNVSNLNTVGFKKSNTSFSELVESNIRGVEYGNGTKLDKVDNIFDQGSIIATGHNTDFAIKGDGFFSVRYDDSNYYTRDGSFSISIIDNTQYLSLNGGLLLDSNEEPIIVTDSDSIEDIDIGVFSFENRRNMVREGGNLFSPGEDNNYQLAEDVELINGHLENSNANLADEITDVMNLQRALQLNSRMIQTADEIAQTVNSLRN